MVTVSTLRTCYENMPYLKIVTSVDLNKCLQVKMPLALHSCVPISELPSNTSTMDLVISYFKALTLVLLGGCGLY